MQLLKARLWAVDCKKENQNKHTNTFRTFPQEGNTYFLILRINLQSVAFCTEISLEHIASFKELKQQSNVHKGVRLCILSLDATCVISSMEKQNQHNK